MTTDIKELVKRLRSFGVTTRGIMVGDANDAADALEALTGEVERLNTERDRLRDTLNKIAGYAARHAHAGMGGDAS